jgi:hypothetical protein
MASNYPQQLAEWVKRRDSTKHPGRVNEFLAARDDVRAAIDAGFDSKAIWSEMRETQRISVSYCTFLAYVSRYISSSGNVPVEHAPRALRSKAKPNGVQSSQAQREVSRMPSAGPVVGFTFNPNPKKEDLI